MNPDYKRCDTCGQLMGLARHICGPKSLEERFWSHVDKTPDCWIWTGSVNEKGYGRIFRAVGAAPLRAHRVSWQINRGLIPQGLMVLHHCDNPPCVRPDHLFLGTAEDNTKGMINKGRQRGVPWCQSLS